MLQTAVATILVVIVKIVMNRRSQWPRDLRLGSAAAALLGLQVRIPPRAKLSAVSVVCCQVKVSAMGRSFVQRSPTECVVSECDLETSEMRSRPTSAVEPYRNL